MNFTTNEEEQHCIARDNHQTWNEEAQETNKCAGDVANSTKITVLLESTCECAEDDWNSPACNMVVLFEQLGFTVTTHNHLVEVECNTERPQEVCQEEIVYTDSHDNARPLIRVQPFFKCDQEGREAYHYTNAQIHDQFDRIRSYRMIDCESKHCQESTQDTKDHQDKGNVPENLHYGAVSSHHLAIV